MMECARLSPRVFSSPVCLPAGAPGLLRRSRTPGWAGSRVSGHDRWGGIGVAATSAAIWLFGRAGAGQRGAA